MSIILKSHCVSISTTSKTLFTAPPSKTVVALSGGVYNSTSGVLNLTLSIVKHKTAVMVTLVSNYAVPANGRYLFPAKIVLESEDKIVGRCSAVGTSLNLNYSEQGDIFVDVSVANAAAIAASNSAGEAATSATAAQTALDAVEAAKFENDLDASGSYINNAQNFPDNLSGKQAGYWFDGGVAQISCTNTDHLSFDSGMSIISFINLESYPVGTATRTLLAKYRGLPSSGREYRYSIDSDGRLIITYGTTEGIYGGMVASVEQVNLKRNVVLGVSFDAGATRFYQNGQELATITTGTPPTELHKNRGGVAIGGELGGFHGTVFTTRAFNKALTAEEFKSFSNGSQVPWKYKGASQTRLVNDSIVTGKEYLIETYVAGDDFSAVGGENVTGSTFVADYSKTTATWSNGSTLVQLGCVLDLNPDSMGATKWFDASGNDFNFYVKGATQYNAVPADFNTIWIGAGAMTPCLTNGARIDTMETLVEHNSIDVLLFQGISGGTIERAQFSIVMPEEWDGGTVKFKYYWTGTDNVGAYASFGIKAAAINDGGSLDSALGTAVFRNNGLAAAGNLQVSPACDEITIDGSPTRGSLVIFEVYRDPDVLGAGIGDTLDADVSLIGCLMQYRKVNHIDMW